MNNRWYLIDNFSHTMDKFDSKRRLKEFAKERGFIIKKSPTHDRTYYTKDYTYLPTGFKD